MPQGGSDESMIAMAREIADEAVRMVRADVELAKKDLASTLRRAIVAVALLALASVAVLIAVVEALGAVPAAFGSRLFGGNTWLPWVALGGVFLVLALIFGLVGYRFGVRGAFRGGQRVVNSVKEDIEWVRRLARRRGKSAS